MKKTKTFQEMERSEFKDHKVIQTVRDHEGQLRKCPNCGYNKVPFDYPYMQCPECEEATDARVAQSDKEEFKIRDLLQEGYVARPDTVKNVAIKQPDGSTFITDSVQAEMTCKCGKSKLWMHAGQISTPCPYCRRQYLAVHHPKTGQFKFIHYNSWQIRLWRWIIGRSPV